MKALARLKDWEGLETFAREKKSPIGLDPFIAAAKEAGAPEATLSRYRPASPSTLHWSSLMSKQAWAAHWAGVLQKDGNPAWCRQVAMGRSDSGYIAAVSIICHTLISSSFAHPSYSRAHPTAGMRLVFCEMLAGCPADCASLRTYT